jgi:hypothetical protein
MMTTFEIAKRIRRSPQQVRVYIARGWLRCERKGRDYLVNEEAVEALVRRLLRLEERRCADRRALLARLLPTG